MKKKNIAISMLGIVSLLLITVGVTLAFFNYTKEGTTENILRTGSITFHYDETSKMGAGIKIEDALPVDSNDAEKTNNKYFSFNITGKSSKEDISYVVTARKSNDSSNLDNNVDIYLTDDSDNELFGGIHKYSDLKQYKKVNNYVEKVIYTDTIKGNNIEVSKNFRLRMWIDEKADFSGVKNIETGEMEYPYEGQTFKLTVNVYTDTNIDDDTESVYELVSGDLDTPFSEIKVGNEHFYIIGKEGNKFKLLSKYNLNVGSNKRIAEEEGVQLSSIENLNEHIGVPFYNKYSENDWKGYWYDKVGTVYQGSYTGTTKPYVYDDNSLVKPYVDNYVEYLESLGATNIEGRLPDFSKDFQPLGCNPPDYNNSCSTNSSCTCIHSSYYDYLWNGKYGTDTFWTGTVYDNKYIYVIRDNGSISFVSGNDNYAVRPLILADINENNLVNGKEKFSNRPELYSLNSRTGFYDLNGNILYTWQELLDNNYLKVENGVLTSGTNAYVLKALYGSIIIDNSVTEIGNDVFSGYEKLVGVTMPNTIVSIGNAVFVSTSNLESINIPASVTAMGNSAFSSSGVKTITFEDGSKLETINTATFSGTLNLESIRIPAGVSVISSYAFSGSRIKNIAFEDGSKLTSIDSDVFSGLSNLESMEIPANVTSIVGGALSGTALKTITFESGSKLTGIDSGIFSGLSNLESIEIPANVTSIAGGAFGGTALKTITFESGSKLETFNSGVFYDTQNLESIEIPASIKTIQPCAFQNSSVINAYFEDKGGWSVDGVELNSTDLSNPTTAATYLKNTYVGSTWTNAD